MAADLPGESGFDLTGENTSRCFGFPDRPSHRSPSPLLHKGVTLKPEDLKHTPETREWSKHREMENFNLVLTETPGFRRKNKPAEL